MAKRSPEETMRAFLSGEDPFMRPMRRVFRRMSSEPHCKLCAVPFGGAGGAIMRHVGFARFAGNPAICANCIKSLQGSGSMGAEIPVSLLFADIRGSTTIAEPLRPAEFRSFLDHFYRTAADAVLGHDGIVDKFVGDEVIGLFFQGVSGPRHAAAAVGAGLELLRRVGRPDASPQGAHPGRARQSTRARRTWARPGQATPSATSPLWAMS